MPKMYETETALRAKDIVNNAFAVDRRNTRYVSPARLSTTRTGYRCVTVTKIPGERARNHVVQIDMDPGYSGPFNRCPHIRGDCSCPRYLYTWNYALLEHDSAIKDRTNTEPPIIRNPQEVPGICVDGDAWIYTKLKPKQLKDIVVGDNVYTLNGFRSVVETREMGKKPTLELHTIIGAKLRVTLNHEILVVDPFLNSARWTRADQLKTGDYIVYAPHTTSDIYPDEDVSTLNFAKRENVCVSLINSLILTEDIPVYDIGVDGTPHFFANGICVHNCKHGLVVLKMLLNTNPNWQPPARTGSSTKRRPIPLTSLDNELKRIRRGGA